MYKYFSKNEPVAHLSGNLPHWRQEGVTYFVTFRLADSLPQEKLKQWLNEKENWLSLHSKPLTQEEKKDYYHKFSKQMQKWFDNSYGSCVLKIPKVKDIVRDSLYYFNNKHYVLDEFIIMPNHVHVLITPAHKHELSSILHALKSFTAHEIINVKEASHLLKEHALNSKKINVWHKESFDHIVRSPEYLDKFRQYIIDNPKGK
jgi:REP element-mobilizing transposase RayT